MQARIKSGTYVPSARRLPTGGREDKAPSNSKARAVERKAELDAQPAKHEVRHEKTALQMHGWAVVVKTAAAIFFASLLVALISSSLAVILILALSVATLHVRDHGGGRVMLDTDAPLVAAGTSVAVCALLLTHGAQLLRWMLQWEPVALDFFLSPTAPFHTTHIWCWRALFLVLTHIGLLEMSPLLRRVALGDLVKLSALHEAMKSQGIL